MTTRKDTFVLTDETKKMLGDLARFYERDMSAHLRWMIRRDYTNIRYPLQSITQGHALVDERETYSVEATE